MAWSKKSIEWIEGKRAFVSVPFTWDLPAAWSRCVALRQEGYEVYAGGPATQLLPQYLQGVAILGPGCHDAVSRHNPEATFTSRGCIRSCEFCAVPLIEGDLLELNYWTPRPIICDNNLLACSKVHFDNVIDRIKPLNGIDFNQGLDCRLLNSHHLDRLQELNLTAIRFSWDHMAEEGAVMDAISKVLAAGFPKYKLRLYVLFNFKDTPADAFYRLDTLKKMGIIVNPMMYQPIKGPKALKKDSFVSPHWTKRELKRFQRYYSQQRWFGAIPFHEFTQDKRHKNAKVLPGSNVLL